MVAYINFLLIDIETFVIVFYKSTTNIIFVFILIIPLEWLSRKEITRLLHQKGALFILVKHFSDKVDKFTLLSEYVNILILLLLFWYKNSIILKILL